MSYVYPFPKASTGRLDQGQDFTGSGDILAIGRARILRTGAPGWPEGGGVLYQLLDGRLRGRIFFVYEGVDPKVRAGQIVQAGQPIATFRPGGSIEIGEANAAGVPLSHGEYVRHGDGFVTVHGREIARLLATLKGSSSSSESLGSKLGELPIAGDIANAAGDAANFLLDKGGEAAGAVGREAVDYAANLLGINAAAILTNIALVGGGAFLVYYGVALVMGVSEPTRRLYDAGAKTAELAAAGAPK